MSYFMYNADMFGRTVKIPTDVSGEMHIYKVIGLFKSNSYCEVPITADSEAVLHTSMTDVLNVVHCGVDESKVIRVALDDCELQAPLTVCETCPYKPKEYNY